MALYCLTLLNFLCGCKLRLQEEILSMACMRTRGGQIIGEIRSGGYEQALPLPEEISHEHIDYLSDSALV